MISYWLSDCEVNQSLVNGSDLVCFPFRNPTVRGQNQSKPSFKVIEVLSSKVTLCHLFNGCNTGANELSPKNTTLNGLSLHISIIPTLPGIRLFMKSAALPLIRIFSLWGPEGRGWGRSTQVKQNPDRVIGGDNASEATTFWGQTDVGQSRVLRWLLRAAASTSLPVN